MCTCEWGRGWGGGLGSGTRWAPAAGLPGRPRVPANAPDAGRYSYSCTEGENRQLWSSGHHLKSCRDVAFSQDGQSECGARGVALGDAGQGDTNAALQSFSLCPRIRPSTS